MGYRDTDDDRCAKMPIFIEKIYMYVAHANYLLAMNVWYKNTVWTFR